jgi:hypothetical protein
MKTRGKITAEGENNSRGGKITAEGRNVTTKVKR